MRNLAVLGELQIIQNSSRSSDTLLHTINAEALERLGIELLAEFVVVELRREDPIVETVCVEAIAKRVAKAQEELTYEEQFDYVLVNDDLQTALDEAERLIENFTGRKE